MARVILKPRRARPFWYGHPWVFSGAVERVKGRAEDGHVVTLHDAEGRCIGHGFFNSGSRILVRVVSRPEEGPPDAALLGARLERAVELRHRLLRLPEFTNAYRLVHGEGDGLPGLVVDRLDRWLVVQVSCLGLVPFLDGLLDRLEELLRPKGVIERVPRVAAEEGLSRSDGVLRGAAPPERVGVEEAQAAYFVSPASGQKTGFYADQRENRMALAPLARGLDVLDAFSYVGGFGLRMALEGAASVHLLDSSEPALELAREGAAANGVGDRVTCERANVLRALDHMRREGRSFDVVVLDPPKLVHKTRDKRKGLRLYDEINRKALAVLRDGGLLVTCSCSQHVTPADFDELLAGAAKEMDVRLQEIFRGGQGPDHPVLLPLDESRYLKANAYRALRPSPPAPATSTS